MEGGRRPEIECPPTGRTLEGRERKEFTDCLANVVAGLEAALSDPDLPEEDRRELEEELAGLRDSLEEIEAGRDIKVGV